ncbi:MAG: hypothetical protein AAGJ32_12435 [Pseudomonadota bacterium]
MTGSSGMKRISLGLILVLGFAAALSVSSAWADATSGQWAFRTDIATKGCTITGEMVIDPATADEGVRACRFVSTEFCGFDDETPTVMEQSCRVITQGDFLLIRSEVTGSRTEGVPVEAYLPDHFTLTTVTGTEMTGGWYDQLYRDAVRFWRPEPVPVS